MVGHGRAAELDEHAAARSRLQGMRLRPHDAGQIGGWVPESSLAAAPASAPAVAPVAGVEPESPSTLPPAGPAAGIGVPPLSELARAWAMDRLPPWMRGPLERVPLGLVVLAVGMVVIVVIAAAVLLHHGHTVAPGSSYDDSGANAPAPASQQATSAPGATTDATSIVVDVGGRVRKPGLVTLPAGARVADAIAAAGGPLHRKEIATVDLAARVSDGQLLLVGVKDAPATGASAGGGDASSGPPTPVGLNSATIEELETLPGVGPVTAQKILDWRSAHNGFTTVAQLQQVPGIGPARYAELSPLVTP
jgi:competence protein ComEA